ncbi:MAG TPA: DUF2214 family protein [Gemmatimonadales bacterium]|nr:DUF2214 family protein [Gemmatimonadales bacterium]
MSLRLMVAVLHLLTLPLGFAAIVTRSRALRAPVNEIALRRALAADNWWGIAAVLWLVTGAWRAFGGLEKGTLYYVSNPLFHAKFGLFGLMVLLELWPMVSLIRWRLALRRGASPDTSRAGTFAVISAVEAALVLVVVVLAAALARGVGV